ncbi:MAG: adenylyl-sulfate kinase [Spirochaetes bacterium]|nr:adenylyl-sulfate kinase [Spirochaetota bacterium]
MTWHNGHVDQSVREKLLKHKSHVLWFTGLSGSGKSTIAVEVEKKLFEKNIFCYRLDGDNIRHGLNSDLGFSKEERAENIRRISEVARLFCDAGVVTLVSFISPYRQIRQNARTTIGDKQFIEIYVKCSIETCAKRDPKGLYEKVKQGEIKDFTGYTSDYEEPLQPDLILDTEKFTIDQAVDQTLAYLVPKIMP